MLYVDWIMGGVPATKDEIRFDCPNLLCDDTRQKFYWNTELHIGHCFKCNYSANLIKISRLLGIEYKGTPIVLEQEKKIKKKIKKKKKNRRLTIVPGVSIFASIKGISYLYSRSVTEKEMVRYEMQWDGTKYAGRVVLPIRDHENKLVGWVGRHTNKYVNPKYLFGPIGFTSSNYLFGLNDYESAGKELVLVEGPFDQIRYGRGSVATFGKHFSKGQLSLLLNPKVRPKLVVILWDPDAWEEAINLANRLYSILKVKVVCLPDGKDPGSISRKRLRRIVAETPVYKSDAWRLACLKNP